MSSDTARDGTSVGAGAPRDRADRRDGERRYRQLPIATVCLLAALASACDGQDAARTDARAGSGAGADGGVSVGDPDAEASADESSGQVPQAEVDGGEALGGPTGGPLVGDLPDDLPAANRHAFAGGATETVADAWRENAVARDAQREAGTFNVPTNGPPSPLFGAEPFSQKMLRFEEFGTDPFERNVPDARPDAAFAPLPAPPDARSVPDGAALDGFLAQPLHPRPTRLANVEAENPWRTEIESFLGRALDTPPAEGRPPGPLRAHQRWGRVLPGDGVRDGDERGAGEPWIPR